MKEVKEREYYAISICQKIEQHSPPLWHVKRRARST
nr:MAG TPA: hypothetical protein [Caudoviricetes sp.]